MVKKLKKAKMNIFYQLLILYGLITVVIYFSSNRSIFVEPPSSYVDSEKIIKLTTADGAQVSALYLANPTAKYTIIFSHGNAEDIGVLEPTLQELHSFGFAVLGYDYHGYGTSQGSASEQATYQDITAAYEYLIKQQHIDPQRIILFGRSVGSGPSIELALHKPVAALILEGAFVSAYRVVTRYPIFLLDKYKNLQKLRNINVPILFIHGTQDGVIPFWHSKKLYDSYNGPKQSYWVEGAGHNDVNYVAGDEYKRVIQSFAESLP
jgi:fermentation-respiration switch protein FrsA (DUF1100 family)